MFYCTESEAAGAWADTPQERSDEETEAMPAKSVHRSGNQQATMVTLLKRTGRTLPGFS